MTNYTLQLNIENLIDSHLDNIHGVGISWHDDSYDPDTMTITLTFDTDYVEGSYKDVSEFLDVYAEEVEE